MSGDKGGSPAKATEVVDKSPWSGAVPYINKGLEASSALYDAGGPSYYPGQTYAGGNSFFDSGVSDLSHIGADFAPLRQTAENTIQSLAGANNQGADNPAFSFFKNIMQGNVDTPGFNELTKAAKGDYLNADNPYFQTVEDRTRAAVLPSVNAQFANAGRGVSGLAARAAGEGLGDAIGTLRYNNYNDERTRQNSAATTLAGTNVAGGQALSGMYDTANANRLNAVGLIPQLQNVGLNAANSKILAGQIQQQLAQGALDDERARYSYNANLPYQNLKDYINNITAQTAGTGHSEGTKTEQAAQPSFWQQALGAAMTGASFFV